MSIDGNIPARGPLQALALFRGLDVPADILNVDGIAQAEPLIALVDDRREHQVEVLLKEDLQK